MALFSLSLLLGGAGHVAFHDLDGECHSAHDGGALECQPASLSLHGALPLSEDSSGEELSCPLVAGEDSRSHDSPAVFTDSHAHGDDNCSHCIQITGEALSALPSPSGCFAEDEVCLDLHQGFIGRGALGASRPRGPPAPV